MPDFAVHSILGEMVFPREEVQGMIAGELELAPYQWGLQGPDPLFFLSSTAPAGGRMHRGAPEGMVAAMTEQLLSLPEGPQRATATAWLAGFLCHYALDRTVHPYVLSQLEEMERQLPGASGNACHYQIETDMDIDLSLFVGKPAGKVDPSRGMALTPWQKELLAGMLAAGARAKGAVLPVPVLARAMDHMAVAERVIFHGGRPVWTAARGLELLLGKRGQYTGHIKCRRPRWDSLNLGRREWMDPWTGAVRRESVPELLQEAEELLLPLLRALSQRLAAGLPGELCLGGVDFSGGTASAREQDTSL